MSSTIPKDKNAAGRWLSCIRKGVFRSHNALVDLRKQIAAWGVSLASPREFRSQPAPPIRFCKLEARRVLNASFDLVGTNLNLSDFDTGTNLEVSHDTLSGQYQFKLSAGDWFDSSGTNTGSNVLSVLDSILNGSLSIDSALATNILLMGDLGSLDRVSMSTSGQVTDANGTQLQTTQDLSIRANSILLGEHSLDSYRLGLANLSSTGAAELHAVGELVVGSAVTVDNLRLVADSLSLISTSSQADLFAESRTGDIQVEWASAAGRITMISAGSIIDAADDASVNLQAGEAIDLRAARDIGSTGTDPFLEFADGSRVIAESNVNGDIRLAGIGSLELERLSTKDGSITVQAQGTIRAFDVDSSRTDGSDNFIHLVASGPSSDLILHRTVAGLINADVSLIATRNIIDGDSINDDADIVGRNVSIESATGWIGGLAGANNDIFNESYQASTSLEVISSNHLRAASNQSIILNPTLSSGSIEVIAPTAVLISNGDLSNNQIDTSRVINLALLADADNDGSGIVILSDGPNVVGDLLIHGQDIASTDPLSFHASRIYIASDQSERFSVNNLNANLDVQIDGQTVGNITAVSNGDIQLTDLNSDGISLRSANGSVLVSSQAGSIDVVRTLLPNRDLLLRAFTDIVVSNSLTTTVGHISLIAGDDILINQAIESTAGGTVCIEAGNSLADTDQGVSFASGATIRTANSNVRIHSGGEGDIRLQRIDVGNAAISLTAAGDIVGASHDQLLVAKALRIEADSNADGRGSIGQADPSNGNANDNALALHSRVSLLAAKSATGMYVINDGNLTIDSLSPIAVKCVNIDGRAVELIDSGLSSLNATHDGPIKLQVRNGDLRIHDGTLSSPLNTSGTGVSGQGKGDILLQATGANSNVIIGADVTSHSGAINIRASGGIQQLADLIVAISDNAVRNSILVEAGSGSISMGSLTASMTAGGNIAYTAANNILISTLSAGSGSIFVNSGGSILDAHSDTVASNIEGFSDLTGQVRQENAIAAHASLLSVSGIGQAQNPLDTSLGSLAASSLGSVYFLESNNLTVGSIPTIGATQIHINSTSSELSFSNVAGIQSADGHAKIETIQGSLAVDRSILAMRDVSLVVRGSEGVAVNAHIQSDTGSISLLANQVQQNADLSALGNDPSYSSVYVRSTIGGISMSPMAKTTATGDLLYDSAGFIHVGILTSRTGIIHLKATGSVLDSQTDTVSSNLNGFAVPTGATRQTNLNASAISIAAGQDIGAVGNPLDTQVDFIAVRADGNVYLYETDAISIGQVAAANVRQVHLDSTSTIRTSSGLAGLSSTTGHSKIETLNGPIDVQSDISAHQAILVAAHGDTGNIRIDANLSSNSGPIHILAQQAISQSANISVNLDGVPSSNSILVESLNGSIQMSPTSRTNSVGGNIVYLAARDIVLSVVDAANGSLLIQSGGSILNAQTDRVGHDAQGFALISAQRTENLMAQSAQVIAGGSIGEAGNPLGTKLTTIALQSGQSSYLLETDSLEIGTPAPIGYTQVQLQSTESIVTSPTLIGGQSAGHFKVENLQDNLNVTAAVTAVHDIQMATRDQLNVDASLSSNAGAISLIADGSIRQNANLLVMDSTSAIENSVFVKSFNGPITMSTNATTDSLSGNILYQSPVDIDLGRILASLGNISISAGGAVSDSHLDRVTLDGSTGFAIFAGPIRQENLVANSIVIRADQIGSAENPLDIDTNVLAADARGEIALLESNGVEIGSVAGLQAKRIHIDSSHQLQETEGLSGIESRDGSISLQSVDGDMHISSNANADGLAHGVIAKQAVLLAAGGNGSLIIHSDILSRGSDVWLAAGTTVSTPLTNPGTDPTAEIQGNHLTIYAGVNAFLPNTIVQSAEARMTQARNWLAPVAIINSAADQAGTLILDDLQHGPTTTNPELTTPQHPIDTESFEAWRNHFRYTDRFADGYSLLIRNHNPLAIQAKHFGEAIAVQGQAPAVYIETLSPSEAGLSASELVIQGPVELNSTRTNGDPGIVLIADGSLQVQASIDLLTPLVTSTTPKTQTLNTLELNASAYHAGQGDPRTVNSADQNIPTTTEYVVDPLRANTEDYRTHIAQRVLTEFGSEQESGFLTLIHYADNAFQVFQTMGDVSKLDPGSNFSLQVGSVNQHAIQNTVDEAALFSRSADFTTFERFFLQNNRDLPTDLVIRRSLDFFLFSNAASGDATEIVDHAAYSQEILDVKSLGTSSMGPITPIPDGIRPPDPPSRGDAVTIERPLALTLPEVELRQVKSEVVEVAIFQISYDDQNQNGQVENVELPSFDSVLNRVDQDSKQLISSKNVGQSPTQGEIDEEKAKLLNSPDQPSGAYAIIRKNADGKEEVLDVFSIRDWPEIDGPQSSDVEQWLPPNPLPEQEILHETSEYAPQAPQHPIPAGRDVEQATERGQFYYSSTTDPQPVRIADDTLTNKLPVHSRFENAAGLLSALWLLQRSRTADSSTAVPPAHDAPHAQLSNFSSASRRQRRVKRLVSQIMNPSEE